MTQIEGKHVDFNQAGWPSGLRRQTQENPQSRILVHEWVRGFDSHSCQKTFWTRWARALSWQILSYWIVNSRWQSKAKENKRLATSLGGWQPITLKVHKKEDTRRRHVKHDSTRGFKCKSFQIDDTNPLADYISNENVTQLKWHRSKGNMSTLTRQDGRAVWGARLKKILSREFWYTSECVGSIPTPVRKLFEHDEPEPSADKFCHTGSSIQDDSPKQKKTKDSQRHWAVDSRAV